MAASCKLQAAGNSVSLRLVACSVQRLAVALWLWFLCQPDVLAFGKPGVRIWLPESVTTTAPAIDAIFYLVLAITGTVFVLVELTLFVFLVRYRRRPGQRAYYTHGNGVVEVIWTVIPALILVLLAFKSQRVWARVRGIPPAPDVKVEIVAQQFAWNVHYPGADGVFGRTDPALVDETENPIGLDRTDPNAQDDVVTLNQLHVPLHQTILLNLKSKDVIHSFFVPQFRLKQDTVPGLTTHLWLSATKTGQYEIVCAELCGLGHYRMRGFLTIEAPETFQAWLAEQLKEQQS